MIELNKNINLNFHQTFPAEKSYISEILRNNENINGKTKEEISEITGIPTGKSSGKVEPHINYAYFMGLIDYNLEKSKYKITLTNLGKIVLDNDQFLSEKLTGLLLHYNLTIPSNNYAGMWAYTFRIAISESYLGYKFKLDSLKNIMYSFFQKNINLSPLISTYLNEHCFNDINIIQKKDNDIYQIIEAPIKNEYCYLYGYSLINEIKNIIKTESEISISEVVENNGWSKIFGFSGNNVNRVLELLENNKIIKLNKQYNPYSILPTMGLDEILNKLYSNLI